MQTTSHPGGLFSRTGVRYEVALEALGSLVAHYAELIGIERSRPAPDEAIVRQALALQSHLRRTRNDLDPRNAAEIESALAHYAPLARRLYADPQNSTAPRPNALPISAKPMPPWLSKDWRWTTPI